MDFDKVSRLVELKKQRTIVGDGGLPLLRGVGVAPMDVESVSEYQSFLKANARQQQELLRVMTPDEIKAAEGQYLAWFQSYLSE